MSDQTIRDQARHELAEIVTVLKAACDRDWKDETPLQVAHIAANAIHWRDQELARLREDKAILQRLIEETAARAMKSGQTRQL